MDANTPGLRDDVAAAARRVGRAARATALFGYDRLVEGHPLFGCAAGEIAPAQRFPLVTRNPFRDGAQAYEAFLYRLDFTLPTCTGD